MADNYLERKMEEHNRPAPRRCNADARRAAAYGSEALCRLRVLVAAEDPGVAADTVRTFRAAGCRTAFTYPDMRAGASLAQATGARCYPCPGLDAAALSRCLADLRYHWGGIDLLVADSSAVALPSGPPAPSHAVIAPSDAAAYLARLAGQAPEQHTSQAP